jgi:MSHA biogenesis protein MshO
MMRARPRQAGFTLVELIVVIVLIGILAGSMVMYFKPAILNYMAVARRASLSNMADGALRKLTTEVRSAVPNSIRLITPQCVELVPTTDGGRFRMAPDTVWDVATPSNASAFLDMTSAKNSFDVLTPFITLPVVGDYVVIDNQTAADVYAGTNRATISAIGAAPAISVGRHKIVLSAPTQFPLGYAGGSFVIVPKAQQAVQYSCVGASGPNPSGTGTGKLYRFSQYGFNSTAACQAPTASTPVVASKLSSCSFSYNPNQGATQQSGFLQVQLGLSEENETVTLTFGAHVDNAP